MAQPSSDEHKLLDQAKLHELFRDLTMAQVVEMSTYPDPLVRERFKQDAEAALEEAANLISDDDSEITEKGFKITLSDLRKSLAWSAFANVHNSTLRLKYVVTVRAKVKANAAAVAAETNPEARLALVTQISEARNEALQLTRAKITPTALAFSRHLKEEGYTMAQLLVRYRGERKIVGEATAEQLLAVYEDIFRASGRTRTGMNAWSSLTGVIGAASVVMIAANIVVDIIETVETRSPRTLLRDALIISGGFASGLALELNLSLLFPPPADLAMFLVGVLAGIIVGIASGESLAFVFDAIWDAFDTHDAFHVDLGQKLAISHTIPTAVGLSVPLVVDMSHPSH